MWTIRLWNLDENINKIFLFKKKRKITSWNAYLNALHSVNFGINEY
jgi:hypothetical protein